GTSEEVSQDCIVMPIWKDTSYFDSPTKDVENGEPKTIDDAQKQVEDGSNNEKDQQEKFEGDSSTKDVNAAGQHVNTVSPDVNTGSLKLNDVGPSVNTASSNEQDSTEDESEVDLGNTTNSYIAPTTPNTRIHKDHPIDNVIGEVKSTIKLTSIAKALSNSSWVEAMQEELLKRIFKKRTKNKAKSDKTEYENEKSVKRSQSQSQSQPRQSQVKVKVNSEKLNQKNTNLRD
ncbi:hypothetical protein Tco_1061943, partial [Tanacetum coccineum]